MKDIRTFIKEKKWKTWKKDQWLVLFLLGILLLVVALPMSGSKRTEKKEPQMSQDGKGGAGKGQTSEYEGMMEAKLEQVLGQMSGVGRVQVMITVKDAGETVVEKDRKIQGDTTEEADNQGGSRVITEHQQEESTVYQDGAQSGEPFVTKETMPQVEGVLVVAEGGGDIGTAKNISEAVEALFDIEPHKIKVVKMRMQEGET